MKRFLGGAAVLVATVLTIATAQAQERPIKLGVLNDMTGPGASNSGPGGVVAAKMAIEDFGGTLLGQPIELVSGDFQLKVDVGSLIARKWFDEDGVDAIVDVPSSPIALAVQQIATEKKRIFLDSGGTSSDLTGSACSPMAAQWGLDTYVMGNVVSKEIVQRGGKTWFFISTDTAFGKAVERDTSEGVVRNGGKVVGSVRFPLYTNDFSSVLLQAASSGANVIALSSTAGDTVNALKQAQEFGLLDPARGITFVVPVGNMNDFKAAGLDRAKGIMTMDGFYWDFDDQTRQFAKRFMEKTGNMPAQGHAATYSVVLSYLKAVQKAGTRDADAVMRAMRSAPIEDLYARNGMLREDGRMISDRNLLQVKSPDESKGEWDIYKVVKTMPGKDIFRPIADGGCPYLAGAK